MQYKELILFTDGGARGNPGPAGIGWVLYVVAAGLTGKEALRTYLTGQTTEWGVSQIASAGQKIGETTNNTAEYKALILALQYLQKQGMHTKKLLVVMDSELVVQQLNGKYKIRKPHLQQFAIQVQSLLKEVGEQYEFVTVSRVFNHVADALVNAALDS